MKIRRLAVIAVVFAAACGSNSASTIAPTSTDLSVLRGWVISMATGTGIGGATVTADIRAGSVSADASGMYGILGPRSSWFLTFSAPGYLDHGTHVNFTGASGLYYESLIPLDAPFSLSYYREFVRDNHDHPGALQPLRRWIIAPKLYFVTRTVDTGDVVPDSVIDGFETLARREMPSLTGGRFSPAAFARGTTPPADNTWIIVQSFTNPIDGDPNIGGDSLVGTLPGRIRLLMRTDPSSAGSGCFTQMGGAFYHELTHAMGFYHVTGGFSVDNLCNDLLPAVIFHARIAYQRGYGNLDPDIDPYYAYEPLASSTMVVR